MTSVRNSNLDLLRAIAILMVFGFHVIQMSPISISFLMGCEQFGKYGVELFFVLSGWLVGCLYWREKRQFGDVQIFRFWMRRWLRTIPPYLVVFLVSWLAVWYQRSEPFDYKYLLFRQNYYIEIPFFLVSWSLCVEEHFYLLMPLALLCTQKNMKSAGLVISFCLMAVTFARIFESSDGISTIFGFQKTATHLHLDGLLIGLGLSYLKEHQVEKWAVLQACAPSLSFITFFIIVLIYRSGEMSMYNWGLLAIPLFFGFVLASMVTRNTIPFASSRAVKSVAIASYSIYLVHPLSIHLSRFIVDRLQWGLDWIYFPIVCLITTIAAVSFYFLVENASILIRDRFVPRRVNLLASDVID
jgi:peptidoglycan/LPS O-acetylase OafA/YrhL